MNWIAVVIIALIIIKIMRNQQYKKMEKDVLRELGFQNRNMIPYIDEDITVKSRQSLEKYNSIKYFKENKGMLEKAEKVIQRKTRVADTFRQFLKGNAYESRSQYKRLKKYINEILKNADAFRIQVTYITSANNVRGSKEIIIRQYDIDKFRNNPELLMTKTEYNKHIKEQQKGALANKQHDYYEIVNGIIDYANKNKDSLLIEGSQAKVDDLISQLFDRTVNSIKKIKTTDSDEWDLIRVFTQQIKHEIEVIVDRNQRILDYYESSDFMKIKKTCESLMNSQKEFNDYIKEKVESISRLFGTRVVRNETISDDEVHYIRPYRKSITPFTAEVSATVFASAENNPLDYVVKYFYPNKKDYPEQIRKLYQLVEELETLRDAKQIIENYKAEYQQYLDNVPSYVMENDEEGFYSRLGFAIIDEHVLNVEYKFSYTSNGGMAQRSFTIPMTEENIAELIKMLENKLTASAFAKEQRVLMTKKLRECIKERDNFTCRTCGNSTYREPNLLLEIDHILPVSKGGKTEESNLQTLCWKCNRAKSDKIVV